MSNIFFNFLQDAYYIVTRKWEEPKKLKFYMNGLSRIISCWKDQKRPKGHDCLKKGNSTKSFQCHKCRYINKNLEHKKITIYTDIHQLIYKMQAHNVRKQFPSK